MKPINRVDLTNQYSIFLTRKDVNGSGDHQTSVPKNTLQWVTVIQIKEIYSS